MEGLRALEQLERELVQGIARMERIFGIQIPWRIIEPKLARKTS